MKSNVVGKVICVVFLLVMLASEGESMGTFIPGGKRGLDINKFREAKSSLCRALECSDLRMAMASQTEIQRKNKGSQRGNTGHDLH